MNWHQAILQDLVFFQRGFDITKAEQKTGTYPVISSSGTTSYHNEFMVSGPGVIIGRKGSLGTVHFSEGDYWPHDTTLWSKDFRGNDPKFVYYFMHTLGLSNFDVGGANPTLNRNHIHKLDVSIPPPLVQHRIASILSAYDDFIAANQRRIQLLEESARLLYREWFVKLKFPGHETVPVTGGVPEEWIARKLSEVADVNSSSINAKDHPESICYVDISSVDTGEMGVMDEISFEEAPGRARRRVQHGDIIWSCVRPNRRSYALIWEPQDNLIVSTGFAVLTARTIPFSYLYLASTTDDFVSYLTNLATGAAYPAVTAKDYEKASILLPDTGTLAAFDQIVLPMLEQIDTIKCQNKILREARDMLLPRLMSGALDVSRIAVPREVEA
jgi:type I restriction enzyme S subunit